MDGRVILKCILIRTVKDLAGFKRFGVEPGGCSL